jgi:hypothetical protein
MRNAFKILVEITEGWRMLRRGRHRGENNLKCILNKYVAKKRASFVWFRTESSCELL